MNPERTDILAHRIMTLTVTLFGLSPIYLLSDREIVSLGLLRNSWIFLATALAFAAIKVLLDTFLPERPPSRTVLGGMALGFFVGTVFLAAFLLNNANSLTPTPG